MLRLPYLDAKSIPREHKKRLLPMCFETIGTLASFAYTVCSAAHIGRTHVYRGVSAGLLMKCGAVGDGQWLDSSCITVVM
jgi:hypothetical protein